MEFVANSPARSCWIRAGSQLQKPDAVLVTTKTLYKSNGMLLPTIVQYSGTRTFTREDGSKVDIAILEENIASRAVERRRVRTSMRRFAVSPAENLVWRFLFRWRADCSPKA